MGFSDLRLRIRAVVSGFLSISVGIGIAILGGVQPAFASHFVSVEADIRLFMDGSTPKAELTLSHKWTSSGSFSPTITDPKGANPTLARSGGSATPLKDSNGNNIAGAYQQVYIYDLSSLTTASNGAGVYSVSASGCCRVASFNTGSGDSFSFELGFYFDPDDPDAWGGSPAFTSSLITTLSKGNDFSQNLGGVSRNDQTLSYQFVTKTGGNAGLNGVDPPTGVTLDSSTGLLTVPGTTTNTVYSPYKKFGVKLKLLEYDENSNLIGYVTRDIGYNISTAAAPSLSVADGDGNAISSGSSISMAAGDTYDLVLSATGSSAPTFTTSNLPNSGGTSWIGGSSPATSGTTTTWNLTLSPPGATSAQTRPVEFVATVSGLSTSFTLNVTITPAGPTIASIGDGSVGLTWIAATGDNVLGYQVRYQVQGSGSWSLAPVVSVGTTSQTITGLQNGTTYVFQVATRTQADGQPAGTANSLSDGDYSPSSDASTPGRPTSLSAPTISPTQILGVGSNLQGSDPNSSWSNPLGTSADLTSSYQWQRDGTNIAGATSLSYTIVPADIGARLRLVVSRANSAGATSASSAQTDAVLPRATLTGLTLSSGALSPAFSTNQETYSVSVGNGVSTITLTPTVAGSESVTIQGVNVTSGSASNPLNLSVGANEISVVVTDGTSGRLTIVVTVTRAAAQPAEQVPQRRTRSSETLPVEVPANARVFTPPQVSLPAPQVGPVFRGGTTPEPPKAPTVLLDGRAAVMTTSVPTTTQLDVRAGALSLGVTVQEEQGEISEAPDGTTQIAVRKGASATITGSGFRPGATVQVFMPLQGDNAKELTRIPVQSDGSFDGSAPFATRPGDAPLPIGKNVLQLVSLDDDGNQVVVEMAVNIAQGAPAPEQNRIDGVIPTMTPGQSVATSGGEPVPVRITPVSEQKLAVVEGDGWSMAVNVAAEDGGVEPSEGGALLKLVRNESALVSGSGFMPGTRADVWLFSDPTLLGTVTIDENGEFTGEVNIDPNMIPVGEHTLQLQGVGEDGYVKAANMGVLVDDPVEAAPIAVEQGLGLIWWIIAAIVVVTLIAVLIASRRRREA